LSTYTGVPRVPVEVDCEKEGDEGLAIVGNRPTQMIADGWGEIFKDARVVVMLDRPDPKTYNEFRA
jgi:hypothetical protein